MDDALLTRSGARRGCSSSAVPERATDPARGDGGTSSHIASDCMLPRPFMLPERTMAAVMFAVVIVLLLLLVVAVVVVLLEGGASAVVCGGVDAAKIR